MLNVNASVTFSWQLFSPITELVKLLVRVSIHLLKVLTMKGDHRHVARLEAAYPFTACYLETECPILRRTNTFTEGDPGFISRGRQPQGVPTTWLILSKKTTHN